MKSTPNRTFSKIFNDKKKLGEMLERRRKGWSLISLGMIYGVDHSSIYYECKKHGVEKPVDKIHLDVYEIVSLAPIFVRRVKSYREYLEEDRDRQLRKAAQLSQLHSTV